MGLESFVKTAQSTLNSVLGGGLQGSSDYKESLAQIYNTDWGNPSLFEITIFNSNLGGDNIFAQSNVGLLNSSILNVETATINESPLEHWVGGQWVYTHGRPELRQVTFTFRDTANGWLYRNFNGAKNSLRNRFPKVQKWNIMILTHGSYKDNLSSGIGRLQQDASEYDATLYKSWGTIMETPNAILESISPISFSQDHSDSFTTFSVTFKYINHIHNTDITGNSGGKPETPLDLIKKGK